MTREQRRQVQERAREFRQMPTRSETLLWHELRGRKLGHKFRRQHPIGPFIADLFCAELFLIIEIDGPIHQTQVDRDVARQTVLEAHSYHLLRLPSSLVEDNLPAAIARIRGAVSDLENPSS